MANGLKQLIQESKIKLLNEDREPKLEYTDLPKKGGKPLAKRDAKVKRVEVLLKNKDIPGQLSSVITKFANLYAKFQEAKDKFETTRKEHKESIMQYADDIFDAEDKLISRVLKTASISVIISKKETRTKLNNDKLIALLKENFKDSIEVLDKLIEECQETTDVASSISVEANESVLIKENKLTNLASKGLALIKRSISSMNKHLKSLFTTLDKRLDDLHDLLTPEECKKYGDMMNKYGEDVVNESKETKEDEEELALDVAINHCEEKAKECEEKEETECAKDHQQLATWLKELKTFKEKDIKEIKEEEDVGDIYDSVLKEQKELQQNLKFAIDRLGVRELREVKTFFNNVLHRGV